MQPRPPRAPHRTRRPHPPSSRRGLGRQVRPCWQTEPRTSRSQAVGTVLHAEPLAAAGGGGGHRVKSRSVTVEGSPDGTEPNPSMSQIGKPRPKKRWGLPHSHLASTAPGLEFGSAGSLSWDPPPAPVTTLPLVSHLPLPLSHMTLRISLCSAP